MTEAIINAIKALVYFGVCASAEHYPEPAAVVDYVVIRQCAIPVTRDMPDTRVIEAYVKARRTAKAGR